MSAERFGSAVAGLLMVGLTGLVGCSGTPKTTDCPSQASLLQAARMAGGSPVDQQVTVSHIKCVGGYVAALFELQLPQGPDKATFIFAEGPNGAPALITSGTGEHLCKATSVPKPLWSALGCS